VSGEEQLEPSTWVRRTSTNPATSGWVVTRNPAKQRSVLSAASMVAGRIDTAI
jgi:hypothetical protein